MTLYNMPRHLTTFIGRESEIDEITNLLSKEDCRLLSLIGAGGMGKTRLSLEIAERMQDQFEDGIFFVGLQPIVSSDNMISQIATAVSFSPYGEETNLEEQLLDFLENKHALLLMDNFEQILEGSEYLAQILVNAPRIKILVTSREALKLSQEWIRPVTGMLVPDNENIREIEAYSAIQLFVQRAEQLRSHFVLEDELPHIICICQLVGGMPLAIELAAAWLKTLSCEEIVSEIQKNLDVLTSQMRDVPKRHQSVRAVFDSTWQMLSKEDRDAFIKLSVFHGTPTRQAIQAVTGASLLALSGLTDKALLTTTEDGRYQIHDLLRQYAYEKLVETDGRDVVRDAHSEYYMRFLADLTVDIHSRRQIEALDEVTRDFENIRRAWNWALERMNYDAVGMAVEALCSYLHFRSRWKQDSYLVTKAQERFAPQNGETPHRIWGMVLARNYTNNEDPIAAVEQALEIARTHDDKAEIGLCLYLMGFAYAYEYNHVESIRCHELSIPYFQETDDPYHTASAYIYIGTNYRLLGDYESSLKFNTKGLDLCYAIGDLDGQSFGNAELSNTFFMQGKIEQGRQHRHEAILLAEQMGRPLSIARQKMELALYYAFGVEGNLSEAKQLVGEAETAIEFNPQKHYKHGSKELTALTSSLFAGIAEDYDEARLHGEQAYKLMEGDAWFPIFSWGLLVAACGQEDYESVHKYTYDLLNYAWELRIVPFSLMGLSFSAILAAYQGNNPRKATELLALSVTQPGGMTGWLRLWPFIDRLQQHLESRLGTNAFDAAWERGKSLEWASVIPNLISEYENNPAAQNGELAIPTHMVEANTKLVEPLSPRELEVLIKIAEGHSNRRIAEQLFVDVSTIKKHITHIYGKLGVGSRTQALRQAQALRLI